MVDIQDLHDQLKHWKKKYKLSQQECTRLSIENDRLTAMLIYADARINKMVEGKMKK